jgi:hypothetical protein
MDEYILSLSLAFSDLEFHKEDPHLKPCWHHCERTCGVASSPNTILNSLSAVAKSSRASSGATLIGLDSSGDIASADMISVVGINVSEMEFDGPVGGIDELLLSNVWAGLPNLRSAAAALNSRSRFVASSSDGLLAGLASILRRLEPRVLQATHKVGYRCTSSYTGARPIIKYIRKRQKINEEALISFTLLVLSSM